MNLPAVGIHIHTQATHFGVQAGIEEAYISLLDVTEDTGKPDSTASEKEEPKPADIAPAFPNSSRPPQEEASTTGRKELPWTRSSCRIKSPSLRLHNGEPLYPEGGGGGGGPC